MCGGLGSRELSVPVGEGGGGWRASRGCELALSPAIARICARFGCGAEAPSDVGAIARWSRRTDGIAGGRRRGDGTEGESGAGPGPNEPPRDPSPQMTRAVRNTECLPAQECFLLTRCLE